MKVSAYFFGGVGYGLPDFFDDTEHYDSLQAVKDELWSRYNDRYKYPCMDEPYYWVAIGTVDWFVEPDYVISIGSRGGIRQERIY